MKVFALLSLAAAATAFVIPDQHSIEAFQLDEAREQSVWDKFAEPGKAWQELEDKISHVSEGVKDKFHEVVDDTREKIASYEEAFAQACAGAWTEEEQNEKPPHKGPPHHGPPHGGPPHRRPHHPPHRGPPNQTVYELIASSKYTTKLAKLISEYPDLVEALNGTKANYTVFAPTDRAFDKIPEHAPKPSKEFLKKVLEYHVSPKFYPAGRVLVTRTIPTALEAPFLEGVGQRVSTQIGPRGLTVNFYARVIAIDIFGTNGVIHGIDSILVPPPKTLRVIQALPEEFSTFELALWKTGLVHVLNDTTLHSGGTLFAPSNNAFRRLPPKVNAFLFSKYGTKYLKALLWYHAAPNVTLYSDAIYKADEDSSSVDRPRHRIPKGIFHIDLETGLDGKPLSINIARYGRFISLKINGFVNAGPLDGVVSDGVIHVVPLVLIPPKELGKDESATYDDLTVEDLKERLAAYVDDTVDDAEDAHFAYNLEL